MAGERSAKLNFYNEDGRIVGTLELFATSETGRISILSEEDALEAGEERVQIFENARYEYEAHPSSCRVELVTGEVGLRPSANPNRSNCGTLKLASFVGRLPLRVVNSADAEAGVGYAALEVRTRKVGYRDDLRIMIEEITEHAVELAFEIRSPTTLSVLPDPAIESKVLYQQFAFLSAILGSKSFKDALHYIATRPHETLDEELVQRDLRGGFRPSGKGLREIAKGGVRFPVPAAHPLSSTIASLPGSTLVRSARPSEDNPENRFIRFALETFYRFLGDLVKRVSGPGVKEHLGLKRNAERLMARLDNALASSVLANASPLQRIPMESVVLQRREGYREVFQAWLKFDLAARLVWEGGSDVYDVGRRDVATLYEYWVFFKLLDIVSSRFSLDTGKAGALVEETSDRLGLKLKSGSNMSFTGYAQIGAVKINARFDYNRSFTYSAAAGDAGSWTQRMRPDYTLSLWIDGISEKDAEANGEIVHLHFDAKYRVDNIEQLFGVDDSSLGPIESASALDDEEKEQASGVYKRADLLKMHAYRDAIRRSYGAYVLYPGSTNKQWKGFHEILPGVGAFVMRPGSSDTALCTFIDDVMVHMALGSVRRETAVYIARRYSEAMSETQ